MATYIKTLKEDNGDITYPQTKAEGVLLNNGSDLETELTKYVTAEDIASTSALTPPVQTNMIADGAVTTAKIADGGVTTDKLADASVTSAKIDWSTLFTQAEMTIVSNTTITSAWTATNIGSPLTVSGLIASATYSVFAMTIYTETSGVGEFRLIATGANTVQCNSYAPGKLCAIPYQLQGVRPNASGQITFQRAYSGDAGTVRCAQCYITIIRTS